MARIVLGIIIAFATLGAIAAEAQETQPAGPGAGAELIRRGEVEAAASNASRRTLAGDAFRVVASLAVVLGLIGLMYCGTRRMLPRTPGGGRGSGVSVLSTTHLTPKLPIRPTSNRGRPPWP